MFMKDSHEPVYENHTQDLQKFMDFIATRIHRTIAYTPLYIHILYAYLLRSFIRSRFES